MKSLFSILTLTLWMAAAGFAQSNPVPFVQQPLMPTSIKPGSAGFTLTVNGAGFTSSSVVNWNGSPRTTTFVSKSQLTAAIQAIDVASRGTASVTVSNPAPGGGVSNVDFFQVTNSEPAVGLAIHSGCSLSPATEADLNSDGKQDLVTLNLIQQQQSFSVLLGKGDGSFQTHSTYSTTGQATSVAAGDFNGDGKLDLAVAGGGVDIYLGNGDGTFRSSGTIAAGDLQSIATGDFNEDGSLDLVVAEYASGKGTTISVLLGRGDGTFQNPVTYVVSSPLVVVTGDFNADGHIDVAVLDALSNSVSILLGNGDGTLRPAISSPTGGAVPSALAAADFNGDGKLDLAVGVLSSVSVLLGNGDGTFQAPVLYPMPNRAYTMSVSAGDFNGDGKVDLVASQPAAFALSLLLGKGNGTFGPPINYSSTGESLSTLVADFNGDGRLDIDGGCAFLQTPRAVVLNPAALTFPSQQVGTSSSVRKIKLTNSGIQPVNVSSITSSGDFSQTNDCPATLDVFKGCMISITFSPTATGTRTGTLSVADNAANSPQGATLTGTGTQ